MKFFLTTLALTALSATATAQSATPSTRLGVGTHLIMPVSVDTGEGLPLGVVTGVNIAQPLGAGFALISEVGVFTPFAKFQPSPQAMAGVTYRLVPEFTLGVVGLYRHNPPYGESEESHLLGGLLAPIIPIDKHLSVLVPVGIAHNLTAGKTIAVFGLRLNISWAVK